MSNTTNYKYLNDELRLGFIELFVVFVAFVVLVVLLPFSLFTFSHPFP